MSSRIFFNVVGMGFVVAFAGCAPAPVGLLADTVWVNGIVLTMNSSNETAQAVAVRGVEIIAVGTDADVEALAGPNTTVVDLKGRILALGFYAAHDNFPGSGRVAVVSVDLNSPPIGTIETIDELVSALQERAAETPERGWIQGRGYDDTLLAEKRHPTREDLDRVSTVHPIYISHTSGHLAVANSLALELAGVTRNAPDPPGGVIQRHPETGEPNGVFEESGGMVGRLIPSPTAEQQMDSYRWAVQDGSNQSYTGFFTQPYHTPYKSDPDYRGYPRRSREDLAEMVTELHRNGYQIAIHANGDAAIDDVIHAFREAQRVYPRDDARHRIEHCQMVRTDLLDEIAELGVSPSFFVGHVYYWGDRHRDIFMGPERAAGISPLRSSIDRGIRFTVHDDTPVTPVDPLQLVWVSVNRLTKTNQILGPDERITPIEAMRAMTIDAAWQNFEENIKGSIEVGKLADLVVLSDNPVTVDPGTIRDIEVVETIVGGETVFSRS